MKRKILSLMLSIMLVIATICVSNMPSRAVEPNDEMTQDETWTTEVLSNSEVTEEELSGEVTETTAEELLEETTESGEKTSENITSAETIAYEENSEPQTDAAVNESGDEKIGQENGDNITKTDAVDFDADTETAGDIEDRKMSVKNGNEDMMLPDEEATEVVTEITEEMPVGAEFDKLENVDIYLSGLWGVQSEGKFTIIVSNDNDFDIYLSCLQGYVTDEKGNEYNVPVSVEVTIVGERESNSVDITNDTKGYWGYNNEGVLTDERMLVSPSTYKYFKLEYTVPTELEGNFSAHIYVEVVRVDNTFGKVVALCSDSATYYKYDSVTNIENSNYYTEEKSQGDLNVDIDVYHDGKYLIAGAETNFYVQISNNNDYDIALVGLEINLPDQDLGNYWHQGSIGETELLALIRSKGLQIIDSSGKNITNIDAGGTRGYTTYQDLDEHIIIKAGETVTYRVDCILYLNSDGRFGDGYNDCVEFSIYLHTGLNGKYCDYYKFFNSVNDTPTVSVDKEDEDVPDMKLDDEAYDSLINSAFTETEIKSGKHLKVDLIIAAVAEASVEQNDLEAIKAAAKKRKIAVILDMNLVRFIDGIISGNVNQLDKEITMTIDVPKEFQTANRKFSIIRLHDGIAEELPDLDDNPNTVTFTTGKFSLYALIYEDVEGITTEPSKGNASETTITPVKDADKTQQAASPNTGDGTPVAALLVIMLVAAAFAVVCIKRMKKNNM